MDDSAIQHSNRGVINDKPPIHVPTALKGFTLIELLAALVLAALLMMTIGQLLSILKRQESLIERNVLTNDAWVSRTHDLLEQDLQNSRRIRSVLGGFELSGFAGRSRRDGELNQRPMTVRWAVTNKEGRLCLIRTQVEDGVLSNRRPDHWLIAVDVSEISMWFTDAPRVRFFADSGESTWSPLPDSIVCQLTIHGSKHSLDDRRTVVLKPS